MVTGPTRRSLAEREEISLGLPGGDALHAIGERLGLVASTISREVAGNGSLFVQGRGELRRERSRCLRTGRAQRRPKARTVGSLPAELVRSLTRHQRRELSHHGTFTVYAGVRACFCDLHSPWQRGSKRTPHVVARRRRRGAIPPDGTDAATARAHSARTCSRSFRSWPSPTPAAASVTLRPGPLELIHLIGVDALVAACRV